MPAKPRGRVPLPILLFTIGYFGATSASAVLNDNRALAPYILTMTVLAVVIILVHLHCNLSRPVLWCLSIWGLLHLSGGLVQIPEFLSQNGSAGTLYSLWFIPEKLRYDQAVHAYGFGITTQLCWELLRTSVERHHGHRLTPSFGIVTLCGLAGMGFGALNEVVEFAATMLLTNIDAGGYMNTSWDMVYNTIGTAVAAVVIYCRGNNEGTDSPEP